VKGACQIRQITMDMSMEAIDCAGGIMRSGGGAKSEHLA